MEDKKQQNNEEYQFIREKVITKKKSRMKKVVLWTAFTFVLAVIFGIVARIVFIYADAPLKKLLGLEKQELESMPTAEPMKPAEMTLTPEPTPNLAAVLTPTENPTPTGQGEGVLEGTKDVTPLPTAEPTKVAEVTPVVELPEPGVEEYESIYAALREVARQVEKSLVTITISVTGTSWLDDTYEVESETTGIIIEKNVDQLLILTSLDRVENASEISLNIKGELYEAELWSCEKDYNIAILRVSAIELPLRFLTEATPASFEESKVPEVGMPIMALGNPNGYMGSMEYGMITGKGSEYYITDDSVELFHTDTSYAEAGDGVIVNLQGKIIGLITRVLKPENAEEMCTAISMTELRHVIKKLLAKQELIYCGIIGEDIPSSVLKEEGLGNGIYVADVVPDSPAEKAGIKTGDIILKLDESNIYTYSGFHTLLGIHSSGDEIKLTLMRTVRMARKQMELTVELGRK